MKTVNICGVPHEIVYKDVIDEDCEGIIQGKILYSKAKILVKKDLPKQIKKEVIIHEMVHGMLCHMGQNELCGNEEFVQMMANAIYNSGFELKERGLKDGNDD